MNIDQGMDQILAFIELLCLILFYLLTTITMVRLSLKSKFMIKRPFKIFRLTVLFLIFALIIAIGFYLSASNLSNVWSKVFLISLFTSLFPIIMLFFSSIVFAFVNDEIVRNISKLVAAGAIVCMFAFLINSSFAIIIPMSLTIMIPLIVAPIIEECLKFLAIYMFKAKNSDFGGYPSIILSAFAIGAGFAFVENFIISTVAANPLDLGLSVWLNVLLNRTYIAATAHSLFTILTLLGFERKLFSSRWNGLLVAILFHVLFNALGVFYPDLFGKEILIGVASLILLFKLLELSKNQTKDITKTR